MDRDVISWRRKKKKEFTMCLQKKSPNTEKTNVSSVYNKTIIQNKAKPVEKQIEKHQKQEVTCW